MTSPATTGGVPPTRTAAGTVTRIRVYTNLRTAHLERFPSMVPARTFYTGTRYDFDAGLVDPANPPVRVTRPGAVRELLRRHYAVVELNEPDMVREWPFLLAQLGAVRLRGLLSRQRSAVVAYCIGVTEPAVALGRRWRLPRPIARPVARLVMTLLVCGSDRLAFGTTRSQAMYESWVGQHRLAARARMFEALPSACDCRATTGEVRTPTEALFVGKLTDRKGVRQLMRAWDVVRRNHAWATLRILGKGDLEVQVGAWAADRPDVVVELDPPRQAVHRALRCSGVLICLSQPAPDPEQIGLPIVEGLSHGCEVVATSETGLARWLQEHGHGVVAPDAPAERVAAEVAAAFTRATERHGSLADLPRDDQRIAADRWLMTGHVEEVASPS
jgi:glycosyltransferase involved in cell wall biosynthesis